MLWAWAGVRFCWLVAWDSIRGRRSSRQRGRRLREAFELVGGMAIKLGRGLALRADLLSPEICDELARMSMNVPAFDLSIAINRIEAAAKRPMDQVFRSFDPTPFRSTVTASIYQAYLKTGERVAVKVRRPGISEQLAADLRCLETLTRIPEIGALVRPGFFQQLRDGLRALSVEEIDLSRDARYQRLFRRWVRKARLRSIYAPKVHAAFTTSDVMVSEFVSGMLYSEMLAITADQDPAGLAWMASLNISPDKVARRVLQLQFWGYLESLFYFSDPSPEDIAVLPGGRVAFLDFGSRGRTSDKLKRDYVEMMTRVQERDAEGMADVALHMLSPLPRVDVYEVKKRIEGAFHRFLFGLHDKEGRWWEHASMNLWMLLVEAVSGFDIPVNFEVLHLRRASMLYDSLSFPLDRQLKLLREYRIYQRSSAARGARGYRRRLNRMNVFDYVYQLTAAADETEKTFRRASWALDAQLRDLPATLMATITKASFVAGVALRFLLESLVLAAIACSIALIHRQFLPAQMRADWPTTLWTQVFLNPVVWLIFAVNLIISIRRVLLRLNEMDLEGYGGQRDSNG